MLQVFFQNSEHKLEYKEILFLCRKIAVKRICEIYNQLSCNGIVIVDSTALNCNTPNTTVIHAIDTFVTAKFTFRDPSSLRQ